MLTIVYLLIPFFTQAMALQELQHPYICGYKEFFVTWDKDVSSGHTSKKIYLILENHS